MSALIGTGMVLASLSIFAYYSTWVFVVPTLSKDHFLNNFFLDKQLAITIPLVLLAFAVVFLLAFLSKFYFKDTKKTK